MQIETVAAKQTFLSTQKTALLQFFRAVSTRQTH